MHKERAMCSLADLIGQTEPCHLFLEVEFFLVLPSQGLSILAEQFSHSDQTHTKINSSQRRKSGGDSEGR